VRVLFAVPRSCNPKQTYREYPLGVGFLGTLLKQAAGHEVSIFDQNAEAVDDLVFLQRVAEFQPALVGFSVITPNYPVARKQIQAIKRQHPQVRVVAGGIHATLFAEDLVADGADAVVLGEGEASIIELVARLESGDDLAAVPGLVFRDRTGEVIRTQGPVSNVPLASLPVADRALYNLPLYTHHSMLASRGCPHHCAFCCNYTGALRNRSVAVRWHEEVLAEMELLRDTFDAKEIFFADDLFLLRKRDILAFCEAAIARRLGVGWIAQMRADQVDSRVAEAMRAAGCQRIYFGVEAGSNKILRRAKKGMTAAQIARGVRAAKAAGLRVKTGWVYGLPGSLEEQYASIPFMLELRPHEISIHQLIPFPGTDYYRDPRRFGIRIADPKAFESFCYGGLDDNIQFDYLSQSQLLKLLEDTVRALESAGYVGSDQARPGSEFVYSTPLSKTSMTVFRATHPATQLLSS
jgi:anaerobic magnesium-protoporphyrin IX monomethyl ester cyclase